MRRLRKVIPVLLLCAGGVLSVATTDDSGETIIRDSTWVYGNLYHGQTAVPTGIQIRLTLGRRDFAEDEAEEALGLVELYQVPEYYPVPVSLQVGESETTLLPRGGLMPDTDYQLNVNPVSSRLVSRRWLPGPIRFSTRTAPRVTGVWMNEQTLIVAFSEPMDGDTLYVGHDSVDLLWQELEGDERLKSLAFDVNLGTLIWETDRDLFLLAPVDLTVPFWLKITVKVKSATGTPLDSDEDGVPGRLDDDFLEELYPDTLPECYTRDDIPEPCVRQSEIPELWDL